MDSAPDIQPPESQNKALTEAWVELATKVGLPPGGALRKNIQYKLTQNLRVLFEIAKRFNDPTIGPLADLAGRLQSDQTSVSLEEIKAAFGATEADQEATITKLANKLDVGGFSEAGFGKRLSTVTSEALPALQKPFPFILRDRSLRRLDLALNNHDNEENAETNPAFKPKYTLENHWDTHIGFLLELGQYLRNTDNTLEDRLSVASTLVRIASAQEGQLINLAKITEISNAATSATAVSASHASFESKIERLARESITVLDSVDRLCNRLDVTVLANGGRPRAPSSLERSEALTLAVTLGFDVDSDNGVPLETGYNP